MVRPNIRRMRSVIPALPCCPCTDQYTVTCIHMQYQTRARTDTCADLFVLHHSHTQTKALNFPHPAFTSGRSENRLAACSAAHTLRCPFTHRTMGDLAVNGTPSRYCLSNEMNKIIVSCSHMVQYRYCSYMFISCEHT